MRMAAQDGAAHVDHRPGRGRKSAAPSSHPPPAHTSHAPGAPPRPAPTAPLTPASPWSRPTRARRTSAANRTFAANGTTTAGVSPRRTRRLAVARAAPTSRSVTDRQTDTVCWRSCVHRGLRSSRRPGPSHGSSPGQPKETNSQGRTACAARLPASPSRQWFLAGCAYPHAATVENFRRVFDEYYAQVRPCRGLDAMDAGTRNSTPCRLREDLRTTRRDTERTAATLVLTNHCTFRFSRFQ